MAVMSGTEIRRRLMHGALEGVNEAAADIFVGALQETPMDTGELRASAERTRATVVDPWAELSWNTVYAAAQHEGEMFYERDGKVIHWVVRNRPGGGKTKWLEHEVLAMIPRYERYIARGMRRRLGG